MSPTNATSSPRDDHVDANPDLARKKQRLSEDHDDSSVEDTIVVEADEPEDIGDTLGTAIRIEDEDDENIMVGYSESFDVRPQLQPLASIGKLDEDVESGKYYLQVQDFKGLASWIFRHCEASKHDSVATWRQQYLDVDYEFFATLGRLALGMLNTADLFEPADGTSPGMKQPMREFFTAMSVLSCRIIPMLPEIINSTLSRRDSASQGSAVAQPVDLFHYLSIATRSLPRHSALAKSFKRFMKLDDHTIEAANIAGLSQKEVLGALGPIVKMLGGAMRQIKDSWTMVQDVLRILGNVASNQEQRSFPKEVFEEIMEVIEACLLPAVCAKHPGALPHGFHTELINVGELLLREFTHTTTQQDVCQTYLRFVKSNEDAVLHEGLNDDTVPEMLMKASANDQKVLSQMLAQSWTMQAAMSYIRSDIMNIRSIGLSILGSRMVSTYESVKHSQDWDDAHVQHAVRFLRKNEVAKYIFSSESHASLVSDSQNVITFLSVTKMWTDQEADVIWRACSTSVEADFVKAAFLILDQQLSNLDFGHVLYILKKYKETAIDGLGATAAHFLPIVLRRLEEFHNGVLAQENRLALAFSTIDILKQVDTSKTTPFSSQLRAALHTEIATFAGTEFSTDDRRQILARCLPDIGSPNSDSTTSSEVLTILLSHQLAQEDTETILSMLPVSTAVEDLQHFVSSKKDQAEKAFAINCVTLRLSCILRLMSLENDLAEDDAVNTIFRCVFGEEALGDTARAAAWDKLHSLTCGKDSPAAAISLWKLYMQQHVPSLPATLASPRLIELIVAYLRDDFAQGSLASDFALLLEHPLWAAIIRFATTASCEEVINSATAAITHFLFGYVAHGENRSFLEGAVKCQRETVRRLIQGIQDTYGAGAEASVQGKAQDVVRAIYLLHALLLQSRQSAALYAPAQEPDLVVLDESVGDASKLVFTVQVYSPDPHPLNLAVRASKTTKVSELLSILPSKTGAAENRVIAGGHEITGQGEKSLAEVGVQDLGVIHIRPRYTKDFDFDRLLMSTGPVEREIVAHFGFLEALVDGPHVIAETAIKLLRSISPPSEARYKVASSSDASADHVFPKSRPNRALFSIHVLVWHLQDCTRVGIADSSFLKRGARLLTAALMDESRDLLDPVTPQLMSCLHTFLQERPNRDDTERYFEDGRAFASRMIDRLFNIERIFYQNPATSIAFATDAYGTLLFASQLDHDVWHSFTTDERTTKLHAKMLLHPDVNLTTGIARSIKGLCENSETPGSVCDFFWNSLAACLSDALESPARSFRFFGLASDVLDTAACIRNEELRTRDLVEQLSQTLLGYHHTESANDLLRDNAMWGLLRLLRDAITILRSFKKPLLLHGLSSHIAEQLLFPINHGADSPAIIHDETKALAYDLLRITLETEDDFERIVEATKQMTCKAVRQANVKFPGFLEWRRSTNQCSGLTNLGMTCYMNSMLQQLFGNVQFRKFVLDQPMLHPEKQVLLNQMQMLFANMQSCVETYQNTNLLAQALGIQIGNQEDVHDFYAILISRLEDEMPDADSKMALSRFFTGQLVTQIRGECGHVSSQKEAFGDLSLTVKNKANLYESLAEYVQGEPMEGANKYKCMSCDGENGRLVDAMRRTCLEEVPDCLTVCLKRFTYGSKYLGEGKVNDRLDFPETLDMSIYQRSHLEAPEEPHDPDIFELVGVIVHQGSMNLGHYWSYVRVPNTFRPGTGDWFYLEDQKTSYCPTGFKTIQQECFGGQQYSNGNERADNAYVLFYQRRQYFAEASMACEGVQVGLPKVRLEASLANTIHSNNGWRHMIASLFDPNFTNYVCWLLNQYPGFKERTGSVGDAESSPNTSEHSEGNCNPALETSLGTLLANFVLRVLLSDRDPETKLSQSISAITTALNACPRLSQHVLDVFSADDGLEFEHALSHESLNIRRTVFDILTKCMCILREQDQLAYSQTLDRLLKAHSLLHSNGLLDKKPEIWREYFALPAQVARQGFEETGKVLNNGYFTWIIEIVFMSLENAFKQKHLGLWNALQRNKHVNYDPLFAFIHDLLSEHVDLSSIKFAAEANVPHLRTTTPLGWPLLELERKALILSDGEEKRPRWLLWDLATPHCHPGQKRWQDHGFSKLLGLLVSDKADPVARDVIERSLALRFDQEQYQLIPLLSATLHYCANTEDGACRETLRILGKNLPLWNDHDKKILWFLSEAYKLAPRSIIETTPTWAQGFTLRPDSETTRRSTAEWLVERVLVDPPLSEDHAIDVARVRTVRAMASFWISKVKTAYENEQPKNRFESVMDLLRIAASFVSKLVETVAQAQAGGSELPNEIRIETDEARGLLPRLAEVLTELEEWASEVVLPTRSNMRIRRSVEIDETDEMVSDEEDDLEDFDEFPERY